MEKLGVNPTYLITQIINFTILVVVLTKLVYKPVLEALEKRKKKIEEGLALTQKVTQEKEELEVRKAKVIREAQKEARAIIDKARDQGKKVEADIIGEARGKAEEIVERGKRDLELRRKEMESRLTRDTVEMATTLSEKLIGDVLDGKKQEAFLKRRVNQFLGKKNVS